MGDNLLFSASLLTPLATLPSGFNIRPLSIDDFDKGHQFHLVTNSMILDFLKVLEELTVVGNVSQSEFETRFREMQRQGVQYMIVIEDTTAKKIAAVGSILIEKKFTHHISHCGHIEDIVVYSKYRGQNLGRLIMEELKHLGEKLGCYKLILDCSQEKVEFYQRCGFVPKERQMALYLDKPKLLGIGEPTDTNIPLKGARRARDIETA